MISQETSLLILVIGAIASNLPHQYYTFDSFSSIDNKFIRVVQNTIFCGLVSLGILVYAIKGDYLIASGGAIIEMVVNFHYYNNQFSERDWKRRIRKNWAAYFFAVIIPSLILLFSHTYAELINA